MLNELPEPEWLVLSDAHRRAISALSGNDAGKVEAALVRAFNEGQITTKGRCRSCYEHDRVIQIDVWVWDPSGVTVNWKENRFDRHDELNHQSQVHTFTDVSVSRKDLEYWYNRAASERSHALKREAAARLFAEPFWPVQRVIRWIAFRDPAQIEADWRAAKRFPKQAVVVVRDGDPRMTLLRALQNGSIRSLKDGKEMPREAWAGATPYKWPPVHFRRENVLAIWPGTSLDLRAPVDHPGKVVDLETPQPEPRCFEDWRAWWIDRFAERQLAKCSFISFVRIADWFSRGARTISEEADQKALAYRRLTESALRGEFKKNGRSRVLLLEPCMPFRIVFDPRHDAGFRIRELAPGRKYPPHRLTRERLKGELDASRQNFKPESLLVGCCLQYCWLPRDLCRQWFQSQQLPWPEHLDPARAKPAAAAASTAGNFRPASVVKIQSAITAVYDEADAVGRKPPNVKQIAEPVLRRLQSIGFTTSKRQIEQLASGPQYSQRRVPAGKRLRAP